MTLSATFSPNEERLEISLLPQANSLRSLGRHYYRSLLQRYAISVVVESESPFAFSFILSESSLLVFDRLLVATTCGIPRLGELGADLLQSIGTDAIDSIALERKEILPVLHSAPSFGASVALLQASFSKQAFQIFNFGRMLHASLAGNSESSNSESFMRRNSSQIVIADIERDLEPFPTTTILGQCGLTQAYVDDYTFTPPGYSLNAHGGNAFATIHYTPRHYLSLDIFNISAPIITNFLANLPEAFGGKATYLQLRGSPPWIDSLAKHLCLQPAKLLSRDYHIAWQEGAL